MPPCEKLPTVGGGTVVPVCRTVATPPVSAEVAGGAGEALVVGRRLGHAAFALVLAVDGDGDVGVGGGARAVRDAAARVALVLLHRAPGWRGRVGRASAVEVKNNITHILLHGAPGWRVRVGRASAVEVKNNNITHILLHGAPGWRGRVGRASAVEVKKHLTRNIIASYLAVSLTPRAKYLSSSSGR